MNEIHAQRLVLRPFRETDYDDLFEFLYQLRDDEFEGYPGITYENGREHLAHRMGSEAFFAVEMKDSGKVIGNIFCEDRPRGSKELGYIINGAHWRKGYGLEALFAVMEDAFVHGAHRVFAECDPKNERSWKLLEKAGLAREAHFKQNIWFHTDAAGKPVWKDTYVFARLNDME